MPKHGDHQRKPFGRKSGLARALKVYDPLHTLTNRAENAPTPLIMCNNMRSLLHRDTKQIHSSIVLNPIELLLSNIDLTFQCSIRYCSFARCNIFVHSNTTNCDKRDLHMAKAGRIEQTTCVFRNPETLIVASFADEHDRFSAGSDHEANLCGE